MTNYERIKRMTIEELADVVAFMDTFRCAVCSAHTEGKRCTDSCHDRCVEWLNKETENGAISESVY